MAYTFQDTEDAQVKKYFHLIGGEKRLENLQLFCQTHLASAPEDDPRHIPRDLVTQAASGSGFYEDHPARLPEMNPVGGVNHRLSYRKLPCNVNGNAVRRCLLDKIK